MTVLFYTNPHLAAIVFVSSNYYVYSGNKNNRWKLTVLNFRKSARLWSISEIYFYRGFIRWYTDLSVGDAVTVNSGVVSALPRHQNGIGSNILDGYS